MTCGHTHFPLVAEHDGVLYVNSGTWTDFPPCPFVVVQGSEVRLEHWPLPHLAAGEEPVVSAALPSSEAAPPALPALERFSDALHAPWLTPPPTPLRN